MRRPAVGALVSLAAVLCVQASVRAGVPELVSFQARLTDPGGVAIDGATSITFRIYDVDAAAVGAEIWTDTISATVTDGYLTVILGQDTAALGLAFDTQYWLGIEVESDSEMTPRFKLAAAPYAIRSKSAETADTAMDLIGDSIIDSTLIADGAVTSGDLAPNSVYGSHLAPNSVDGSHLVDGAALAEIADDDGAGSGLDADLLDGQHASAFLQAEVDTLQTVCTRGNSVTGSIDGPVLYAENTSTAVRSSAIRGRASATSGVTYGVWAQSDSTSGGGVYGWASAANGTTNGLYARNGSTSGRGVYADATAGTGITYGVYARSESTDGRGVFAYAPALTGNTYGVWASCKSTSGRGVYGAATAGSGTTYGIYGYSSSTSGCGVYGYAGTASGTTYGVYGRSNSPTGYDFFAAGNGTDYGSSSSIRWKSDIRRIPDALRKVQSLRGVYFNWDEEHGGQHDLGMIAEEVGEVVPEIVQYEENGSDAIGMDYSKLTPVLVEAVKALKEECDERDSRVKALESELASLKERLRRLELTGGP